MARPLRSGSAWGQDTEPSNLCPGSSPQTCCSCLWHYAQRQQSKVHCLLTLKLDQTLRLQCKQAERYLSRDGEWVGKEEAEESPLPQLPTTADPRLLSALVPKRAESTVTRQAHSLILRTSDMHILGTLRPNCPSVRCRGLHKLCALFRINHVPRRAAGHGCPKEDPRDLVRPFAFFGPLNVPRTRTPQLRPLQTRRRSVIRVLCLPMPKPSRQSWLPWLK